MVALTVLVAILFGWRPTPQTLTPGLLSTTSCHPLHAWEDSPERLPADKGTENGHVEIKVDMTFQLYSRHFEFNVDMLTLKV